MKDVMGLIFTGENDIHLGELTSLRAVAALPIAGRYRVIDFQLSSMVHSGIKNVGVITQKNYSSLMDHIGSGREWDLHGKQGLVMLPPFLTRENMGVYSGLLDALKSNCTYPAPFPSGIHRADQQPHDLQHGLHRRAQVSH